MRERKMDKRIQCPVCGKEGVLQWKETVTKAKGKTYRYKKLYVYHWNPKKPRWCYLNKEQLEALETPKRSLTQNKHSLTQNLTQNTTNLKKPESGAIPQKRQLHQFNAHKNLFRHSDPHNPAHDTVFRVDVDETFVNAHLPAVPRCGALAAGRFSNRDLELLCRQRNGPSDLDARLISDCLQFSTDSLQFRVVRTG